MTAWETIDKALGLLGIRIGPPTPGQTTGGTHVAGSEHYDGRARDYGVDDSDADAIARALVPFATGPGAVVDELFYSPLGIFFDKGQAFEPDADLRTTHYSHVHVGLAPGADLAAAVAAGGVSSSSPTAAGTATQPASGSGGGLWDGVGGVATKALYTVAFAGAGIALVGLGIHQAVNTLKRRAIGAT